MDQTITRRAYPRLGLLGNPADALGGPALSVTFSDFCAEAAASPSECLRLMEPEVELPVWEDIEELAAVVQRRGYHGGRRLMMAALMALARHCRIAGLPVPPASFALSWTSTIPLRVGLAGSSALVIAAIRAAAAFWELPLAPADLVEISLRAETVELGIPAGPQDRVAQAYEGLVYFTHGESGRIEAERLDLSALPPLFVAIDEEAGEGTEVFHSTLRERFQRGDSAVVEGVARQADLTRRGVEFLRARRGGELGVLMDENFEIRRQMSRLNPRHERMVDTARAFGAHAKFAGSGGAIVGTCEANRIEEVIEELQRQGYKAFRPALHPSAS